MTGDIVNLREFRKRKARAEKQAEAEENRTRHGRTKVEREIEEDLRSRSSRLLDAHRIDDEDEPV